MKLFSSRSHRMPAAAKLVGTAALILGISLLPRQLDPSYLVPGVLLIALAVAARISISFALRRLALAQLFIIGIAGLLLLSPGGFSLFAAAYLKSNLCVLALILLISTTPFSEILHALKQLKVPGLMITTLALMMRYLPVVVTETKRMERARASRTFSQRKMLAWHNVSLIVSQLLLRTNRRAERIYLAMCARGWK